MRMFKRLLLGLHLLLIATISSVAQANPPNDNFINSFRLEGTSISTNGNLAGATLESGEIPPESSGMTSHGTIWYSWAAPATGRAYFSSAPFSITRRIWAHTGSEIPTLIRMPLLVTASNPSFLAREGTVYHFQIGSYTNNNDAAFTFNLSLVPEVLCDNDYFSNPALLKGESFNGWPTAGPPPPHHWFLGATTELGEPAHTAYPSKSLWWKWNAPANGSFDIDARVSTASNVVLSIYHGPNVAALSLLAKATNQFWPNTIPVKAGETYYLCAAVATNVTGDVLPIGRYTSRNSSVQFVPGNLLQNPSFENGFLSQWNSSGSIGGYVGSGGWNPVDGGSWPVLGHGAKIWQDFATTPGRDYRIRFGYRFGFDLSNGGGARTFRVLWDDQEIGLAHIPADEGGYWHWAVLNQKASNTTSRLTIENLTHNADIDAFSVVDASAPPHIVTQPQSITTFAGGSAAFVVGVTGSAPLSYQWFFNGQPLPGATDRVLEMNDVPVSRTGTYFAQITNHFGTVTSDPATLTVEWADEPVIVWHPYSETVPAGSYFALAVVARGTPPLKYQWYKDEQLLPHTNSSIVFTNVQLSNAGVYKVRVVNFDAGVWSLPATLKVVESNLGGGTVYLSNNLPPGPQTLDEPVFEIDGMARLNGSNYVGQIYAGPEANLLRPAGQPQPFQSGFNAGYIQPSIVTLLNVPPETQAFVQLRVWDKRFGSSFEEARATGGKFGKSATFNVTTGGNVAPPASMFGLKSFALQAGFPEFTTGRISFQSRAPGNVVVWMHSGNPGYQYLIEKRIQEQDWHPYVVVTNISSTVTFQDTASSGSHVVFYRSRILD